MRNRQGKVSETSVSTDFVLTTDDEREAEEQRWLTRATHRPIQLVLLIGTASLYLLHTVRAYVPSSLRKYFNETNSFVELLSTRPITRIYTSDLRPSFVIENLLLRIAENWQVSRTTRGETTDERLGLLLDLCSLVHSATNAVRLRLSCS